MSTVQHTAHIHHGPHPPPPVFALPQPSPQPPPHRPPGRAPYQPHGGGSPTNYQNYFNPYPPRLPQHVLLLQDDSRSPFQNRACFYGVLALCCCFVLFLIYELLS
ncbi:hypothetical protein ACSBR2_006866 [Camellia fascicularis]